MKENSENHSDLPRPQQYQANPYNLQNTRTLPELRRKENHPMSHQANTSLQNQNQIHKANRKTKNAAVSDTLKMPACRNPESIPDDVEYAVYEEDIDYGAYEEYDRPDAYQRKKDTHRHMHQNSYYPSQAATKPQRKRRQSPPEASSRIKHKKSNKQKKKGGFLKKLFRSLFRLLLILFIIYSVIVLLLISRIEKLPTEQRYVTDGKLDTVYVRSILLIGTDARDITAERGRSDTMILLSLNSRTRKIYLTSFMRDAYVNIPNYGYAKLNAAYSYGGAELLMDTLEYNYQVSIDDYVCVSFLGFASIIDAFGGVEVNVSDEEAQAINVILQSEVNALAGDDPMSDFLEQGGTYILNGKQALSYARIRYVGNADFERTSRQREVMTKLMEKAKTKAVTAVPQLISSAMPNLGTNMPTAELYLLSLRVPFTIGYTIEQIQIPADGTYSYADIDGQSVLQVDFEANMQQLQDTVYSVNAQ